MDVKIIHPELAEILDIYNDGLVIDPVKIARQLDCQGIEAVLVKPWLEAIMFTDFDPSTMKYRDQMWELENNDVLIDCTVVASRRIIFQGIHDIVEHAPGTKIDGWNFAAQIALEMHQLLSEYFQGRRIGNIPSHLPPYLAGILLDDLTQARF